MLGASFSYNRHRNRLFLGFLTHKNLGSKANSSGFDSSFGGGSKQVRFGFDSGSISHVRIRFGFVFFGFDTALAKSDLEKSV